MTVPSGERGAGFKKMLSEMRRVGWLASQKMSTPTDDHVLLFGPLDFVVFIILIIFLIIKYITFIADDLKYLAK